MRLLLFLMLLFCAIVSPVFGELTQQDLDKIRAWQSRKDREQTEKIEQLSQEIEMLKQQRTVNP